MYGSGPLDGGLLIPDMDDAGSQGKQAWQEGSNEHGHSAGRTKPRHNNLRRISSGDLEVGFSSYFICCQFGSGTHGEPPWQEGSKELRMVPRVLLGPFKSLEFELSIKRPFKSFDSFSPCMGPFLFVRKPFPKRSMVPASPNFMGYLFYKSSTKGTNFWILV